MAVRFHFQKVVSISGRNHLKVFVPGIFNNERKQMGSLDFIFCSNAYLLKINRDFLGHDYYTDIITFDMSSTGDQNISGEIYISVDMVKINSNELGTKVTDEMLRVMFHGVLHLCGYKDKTKEDKKKMREREDKYLNDWNNIHNS